MELRREIFTVYAKEHDLTFIMEEMYDDKGNSVSLEVKGFYFGEPNADLTERFYEDYRAEFSTEGGDE